MVIGVRNIVVYNTFNEKRTMLIDLYEESWDEVLSIYKEAL